MLFADVTAGNTRALAVAGVEFTHDKREWFLLLPPLLDSGGHLGIGSDLMICLVKPRTLAISPNAYSSAVIFLLKSSVRMSFLPL